MPAARVAVSRQAFADGDGAIHIKSAEDLQELARSCTLDSWSRGKTVVLDNDIVLESDDALPIPTFGGTFRGNGYTISGLSITQSVSPAGLFGVLQKDAVITELNVEGTVSPSGDSESVGGIVGAAVGAADPGRDHDPQRHVGSGADGGQSRHL